MNTTIVVLLSIGILLHMITIFFIGINIIMGQKPITDIIKNDPEDDAPPTHDDIDLAKIENGVFNDTISLLRLAIYDMYKDCEIIDYYDLFDNINTHMTNILSDEGKIEELSKDLSTFLKDTNYGSDDY